MVLQIDGIGPSKACSILGAIELGKRIAASMPKERSTITGSEDVAVIIEACHSCMTARGIKNTSAATTTTTFSGRFRSDQSLVSRLALQL